MIELNVDGNIVYKTVFNNCHIGIPSYIKALAELQEMVEAVLNMIDMKTDLHEYFNDDQVDVILYGSLITGLLGCRFNDDLKAIQSFIDEYIITFFKDFNGEDEKE